MMTTLSEIALWVMYSTTVDRDSGHEEATVEGGSQSIEYGVFGTVEFNALWEWSEMVFNVVDFPQAWTLSSKLSH